jgi:hypothetical protein
MTGYHTRWARPEDPAGDPERLAMWASPTERDIECIEEGGTEHTIPMLRRLAAAFNADVHLTAGHDLSSAWFETHAA